MGHGGRDLETFGGSSAAPSVVDDELGQAQSPGGGQWCVSVGHGRSFLVSLSVVTQDNHRGDLPVLFDRNYRRMW